METLDLIVAVFVFLIGACVGSFINVVVYRLPRVQEPEGTGLLRSLVLSVGALSHPPSTCPKCGNRLAWYDNIPVLGWLLLRGRCRYCRLPISPRYPLVEALTGGLFLLHFFVLFVWQLGPCHPVRTTVDAFGIVRQIEVPLLRATGWPILALHLWMIASLLAASLIDAEHFHIPLWVCWIMAAVGIVGHPLLVSADVAGSLAVGPLVGAMAAGGAIGLCVSLLLLRLGWLARSFADGEPILDALRDRIAQSEDVSATNATHAAPPAPPTPGSAAASSPPPSAAPPTSAPPLPGSPATALVDQDVWTPPRIRAEMRREMAFLLPPMSLAFALGALNLLSPGGARAAGSLTASPVVATLLGAIFGALVGGLVVWVFRILGSYVFGREAMGLGDVHLMFGVGAVIGAGAATVGFFLAPLAGLAYALYALIARRQREVPFGPYLGLGSYVALVFYCPIALYLAPGLEALRFFVGKFISGA